MTVASLVGLVFAGLALGTAPSAQADRRSGWRPPAQVMAPVASVTLQSPHGGSLRTVEHRGRTFVAGNSGDRYAIRVHNNSANRIEVVVSVDGRDVVSGELGNFAAQRGYVIQPFDSVVIDGFRTSLHEVAAFRFSSVGESFAGKLGTPQHAGVIGIAVFREQPRRVAKRRHHRHRSRAEPRARRDMRGSSGGFDDRSPAPPPTGKSGGGETKKSDGAASSRATRGSSSGRKWSPPARRSRELGTEFGERRSSAVREVAFVRASARRPDLLTEIQYDTARGLAARGVPIEHRPTFASPPPGHHAWPAAQRRRFARPPGS